MKIGNVTVELLARIGDAEPQSLGNITIPLTIRSIATGTIEGQLSEAIGFVRVDLERVFAEPTAASPAVVPDDDAAAGATS